MNIYVLDLYSLHYSFFLFYFFYSTNWFLTFTYLFWSYQEECYFLKQKKKRFGKKIIVDHFEENEIFFQELKKVCSIKYYPNFSKVFVNFHAALQSYFRKTYCLYSVKDYTEWDLTSLSISVLAFKMMIYFFQQFWLL